MSEVRAEPRFRFQPVRFVAPFRPPFGFPNAPGEICDLARRRLDLTCGGGVGYESAVKTCAKYRGNGEGNWCKAD